MPIRDMDATCHIIYTEGLRHNEDDNPDAVFVEVRRWHSFGRDDLVIECQVAVDNEVIVDEARVLDRFGIGKDVAAIRYAIARYDKLLDAHPTLSRRRAAEQTAETE